MLLQSPAFHPYVGLLQYRGIIARYVFLASDIPNSTHGFGVYWPEADDFPSGGWVKDVWLFLLHVPQPGCHMSSEEISDPS